MSEKYELTQRDWIGIVTITLILVNVFVWLIPPISSKIPWLDSAVMLALGYWFGKKVR
ncbi:MAG: hypothetical protein QW372_01785 [Nitrososphaerales archaeon]